MRDARDDIPTDIDEYSDCRDVLRPRRWPTAPAAAVAAAAAPAGGGAGGGSGDRAAARRAATPSTPADTAAIQQAQTAAAATRSRSAAPAIAPGVAGPASGAPRTGLPTGTIVVLVLLGIAALAAGAPLARRRARLAAPPWATLGEACRSRR